VLYVSVEQKNLPYSAELPSL